MAVDKLVDSTQLDTDLTSIANAIRTKGGTSASLAFPADFVSAIEAISGGGDITIDGLAAGTEPSGEIEITRSSIVGHAFRGKTEITRVEIPNTCSIANAAFSGCTGLTSVFAPLASSSSSDVFNGCTNLKHLVYGTVNNKTNTALGCTKLEKAEFNRTGNLAATTFSGCTAMNVLVIRTSTLVALSAISAFNNSPFASGKAGGTLYVPSALISSYQAATNWSTILGYANNSIEAIEGSIYETQYVDGTPIPT